MMTAEDRTKNNAAIYYLPTEFSRERGKLMGRQSAGEAFVKALGRHGEIERYFALSPSREAAQEFGKQLSQARGNADQVKVNWIRPHRLDQVSEPGCLMTYDPGLPKWAWQRQFFGASSFSICGITHTTASHSVMDSFGALPLAPVYPWDALICTSICVKQTVENIYDRWTPYLAERLGATKVPKPMLPVIPLGVDCDAFADTKKRAQQRQDFRRQHNIGDDDIVVLFLGRLSFHAKANPYPMYLALEQASRQTGKNIHLVQTGWFSTDGIEQAFKDGARDFAPSVNVIFADGKLENSRACSWAAADIFCSLVDNVQETFGLTPIEAMAAGLPLVVSDWDGYRDTMRQGVDGFAIPTLTPPDGSGQVLAQQHALDVMNYDHYIGHASISTAVDIAKTRDALVALIENPALRRKMGAAGKQRARDIFDWRHVIASYQNLWQEMSDRRHRDGPAIDANPALQGHPSRPDPFQLFDTYPTARLNNNLRLRVGRLEVVPDLATLRQHKLTSLGNNGLVSEEECQQMLTTVADQGPLSVVALLTTISGNPAPSKIYRTIGWLLKMGLIERVDED